MPVLRKRSSQVTHIGAIFGAIGRFAVRFRWLVVLVWIAGAVAAVTQLPALSSVTQGNNAKFQIALISRTQAKLDTLAATLSGEGIQAAGFTGNVLDRPSLRAALTAATQRFGTIDLLDYSPAEHNPGADLSLDVTQVSAENVQPQIEYYVYGAITAAQAVLGGMLDQDNGTLRACSLMQSACMTTHRRCLRIHPLLGITCMCGRLRYGPRELVARQINLFCAPQLMSTEGSLGRAERRLSEVVCR